MSLLSCMGNKLEVALGHWIWAYQVSECVILNVERVDGGSALLRRYL